MPGWNEKMSIRTKVVTVKEILNRQPNFIVIRLSTGKEQKLNDTNFPDWRKVTVGREIDWTIQESITRATLRPVEVLKAVRKVFQGWSQQAKGPFYILFCGYCERLDLIEYTEGDASLIICDRIRQTHQEKGLPECDMSKIRLFEYRNMEIVEINDPAVIAILQAIK